MISVNEAVALIREQVLTRRLAEASGVDLVDTKKCTGRVLAQDVLADRDFPPFDRVTMDGVAVATAEVMNLITSGDCRLRIAATQAAGEPPATRPAGPTCIEIMTGAPLAHGCDAVLPVEWLRVEDGWAYIEGPNVETVRKALSQKAYLNLHRRGSDSPAGDVLLRVGKRLHAPDIAALASVGSDHVKVVPRPRVCVITTGNEAVAAGSSVKDHQIRQSNGPAILAALLSRGISPVDATHVPDERAALRKAVQAGLGTADVVILTGGVSAGRYDLVPDVLADCGVQKVFHKVRQRPGKPLWFGAAANGPLVFGLPGNPVSALISLYRYALPALRDLETVWSGAAVDRLAIMAGPRRRVICHDLPDIRPGMTRFIPVRLEPGGDAVQVAMNGSGDLLSLTSADGFVERSGEAPGDDRARNSAAPFYAFD